MRGLIIGGIGTARGRVGTLQLVSFFVAKNATSGKKPHSQGCLQGEARASTRNYIDD